MTSRSAVIRLSGSGSPVPRDAALAYTGPARRSRWLRTAFSPTDVLLLSRWAKVTMMVQSAVALTVVVLVVARAVNVLG